MSDLALLHRRANEGVDSREVTSDALHRTTAAGGLARLVTARVGAPTLDGVTTWAINCVTRGATVSALASPSTTWATIVGMATTSRPVTPASLLVRVMGHAPRSLRRRISVIPAPLRRSWTSMSLTEAACWALGRAARSVHLRVTYTLGSFILLFIFSLIVSRPVGATAIWSLVILVALVPPSPMGRAGGASSAARTATPPAAVAAATCITAGTPVSDCTGTQTSFRTIGDYGRGATPACQTTSRSTWRILRAIGCAVVQLRRYGARLPALVVAAADCCLAWAEASSSKGKEGG